MKTLLSILSISLLLVSHCFAVELNPQMPKVDPRGQAQTNRFQFGQTPPQQVNKAPGQEVYLPECGQACAFDMAGQAYSMLGGYIQTSGPFADQATRDKAAKNVTSCIQNPSSASGCDKDLFIKTLVQYNFSRQIRQSVLENQTNQESMKTDPIQPKKNIVTATGNEPWMKNPWFIARKNGQWVQPKMPQEKTKDKNLTFRLNPESMENLLLARAAAEREILGQNILNDYRAFVKAYAVPPGENSFIRATPYQGKSEPQIAQGLYKRKIEVDKAKQLAIQQQMSSNTVRQLTTNYQRELETKEAPKVIFEKNSVAIYGLDDLRDQSGIGKVVPPGKSETVMTPKEAKEMAINFNKHIDEAQAEQNKKDLRTGQNTQLRVTLNIDEFDKFLDEIWPPGIKR